LDPAGTPAERFEATATATVNATLDFVWRGLPLTRETGHYLLVLGLLCWANGQFAASSVFRHGRPIGPIIVLGTVLVANMAATSRDQIWFLVLFSMAALFLLTRLHALDERATWIRRRIGDPATVGSLYLRGGTIFIVVAIFGSLALTATAHSAPLAGFWDDARPALVDISQWLQRIIPAAPDAKTLGVPSFGQQVTIGGIWSTKDEPALEITRRPGDNRRLYWRATSYDSFTLFGWASTNPKDAGRPSGTDLLGSTADAVPATSTRTPATFGILPQSNLFKVAFSPLDPVSIDLNATLRTSGEAGFFQSIAIPSGVAYNVSASLQEIADVEGGVTRNRLRAAGMEYPADIVARYTRVPDLAMGPAAKLLLGDIEATVKASGTVTPFDFATTIVNVLQDSTRFQYSTRIPGVCDREPSIVECFAAQRTGFCEHYASTMVILLRKEGIAARLAEGFLPGKLDVATGRETISTAAAHAWVEVYFPGIGWYPFDPTGGGRAQEQVIPDGSVQPIPSPRPSVLPTLSSRGPDDQEGPDGSRRPTGAGSTTGGGNGSNTPAFIAISIILLAAILLAAFLAWRRGPRGVTSPEGVYASVAGLARRFGFGPRPTQTTFEYATALGDVLPGVRPELQTVATAKVEVAYGRRELGDDRIKALRDAYRKLRVGLLRLAFRRGERRRMR
ncbi:MAG: transglutaminase domain-containing protein, partial [Candidatus Limnocylindrales bacterium]